MPASCSGLPGAPPGTAQPRLARLVELTEHAEWLPQSPCTNLCDLGFFRSVDSRLPKLRSFSMPTFIKQIEKAFKEYPDEKLDDLCGVKTRVCVAIVENKGDNNFGLPNRKKKS